MYWHLQTYSYRVLHHILIHSPLTMHTTKTCAYKNWNTIGELIFFFFFFFCFFEIFFFFFFFLRESNFRYIRDSSAILANLYMWNFCHLCVPKQIWHLDVLFVVPLYYATSASLQAGQWIPSWLHRPTFCRCPTNRDSASELRCLVGRETVRQRELKDHTVGLQLSS